MAGDDAERRRAFDDVAASYERARPVYPAPAFDDLFDYLHASRAAAAPAVLEIGPGTGQATGALLARGARVTAVELGPRLAQFLRDKFAGEPLEVVTGAFEDVDLPRGHYDLVCAATSFHWLDRQVRVPRAVDLLAPGGVLATISTIQIRSDVDRGYFASSLPIYEKYGLALPPVEVPDEADAMPADAEELRASGLVDDVVVRRYRWDQNYTSERYAHLVRSYSNTSRLAPLVREQFVAELCTFIDAEFGGSVVRPLVIALTAGRRPPG